LVVDLRDGSTEADLARVSALVGGRLDWVSPHAADEALAVGDVADLRSAIARLRADPRVEVAEAEQTLWATAFPNDPHYPRQWNLRRVGAAALWRRTPRGAGIRVAVLDTGVSPVEDLPPSTLLPGVSLVPGVASAADDQGHGTHVAGTIAQATHNGLGVAGMAPAVEILPIKVLAASGAGSSATVAAGIDYAVDHGAQVVHLSLGGPYSDAVALAVSRAVASGALVVAAAGNTGTTGVAWPAGLPQVIGVGAVGPGGALAPYSSFGEGLTVLAPGGDTRQPDGGILQDTVGPDGGHAYRALQGTSMAAPHVTGAVAALLSAGLSPAAARQALVSTATDDGIWSAQRGFGEIDLPRAVRWGIDAPAGLRACVGLLLAIGVARVAGRGARFAIGAAGSAVWASAGCWILPALLPVETAPLRAASSGLLLWPAAFGIPTWVHAPGWASAALPLIGGVVLGGSRWTRPVAVGLASGIAAHLLWAAATNGIQTWWLPIRWNGLWLASQSVLSLGVALGLAGHDALEERRP